MYQYEMYSQLKSFSFDPMQAINNSIRNKITFEVSREDIEKHKALLLSIWTSAEMQTFINSIDYDWVKNSIVEMYVGRKLTNS